MSNADKKIYIDSETCGLHGVMVLLQYAVEDGPIVLYDLWKKPVGETLILLEWICEHTVIGFNLSFDVFHLVKIYTIWSLLPRDWIPEDHVNEIARLEPKGQEGPCLKPANALDLLLHSRKGPYQSLMARSDIRIRRVPTALAYALADELEQRVQIDGIYFARSHDPDAPKWQVFDVKGKDGIVNPHFKDVVLRFSAAGGLKYLAEHALGYKPKYHFKDVEPASRPKELGYAPTALAVSRLEKGWAVYGKTEKGERKIIGYAWPGIIKEHIDHWAENANARDYATDDIVYTRDLYKHFGSPTAGDNDSILACMVPVIRWRGFKIDLKGIRSLLKKARAVVAGSPININKPPEVRRYIYECMDDSEKLVLESSTKKANIIAVAKFEIDEPEECTKCDGHGQHENGHCHRCNGTGTMRPVANADGYGNHPAAVRAKHILDIKIAGKEVELYRKLRRARKLHASFKVVGTLSSRMSGGDGLNTQGIKATKEVRCVFPLAWEPVDQHQLRTEVISILKVEPEDYDPVWARVQATLTDEAFELSGGDFDSFEVTLADAVYDDPHLRKALTTKVPCHKCNATGTKGGRECGECDGTGKTTKKIHALFAMCLFPGYTYEQILATAGTENDLYTKGKQGVFAMIYGGDFNTLVRNLGIAADVAKAAFDTWNKWFPGSAKARERTFKSFCSMSQPAGIGSQVVWAEPVDYVESFLGFRRHFTLENKVCRALFQLANNVPDLWKKCKVKVVRRDRVQTAGGAVSSALYGAAFQIQAANQRAAANHEIQSPGGEITKGVQRKIWDLQPAGVHELLVAPMNVHDELMVVTHPDYIEPVAEVVQKSVESYRDRVPLIGMTWNKEMASWAEKKGGAVTLKIRAPELMAA